MRISDSSSDVSSSDLSVAPGYNAPRPAGHLGDSIRPEMLDDLIERARHRRQCRQSLDHRIAAANGLAVDDRVAVVIAHRPRRKTALIVRSEEHTSELQSLMRISYAVFWLKRKNTHILKPTSTTL